MNKMKKRIAIQGFEGSFHQIAAEQYFGQHVEAIMCPNFRELIKIGSDPDQSEGAIMAIENSIAGSILPNYSLLEKSNLGIAGEIYLKINHYLIVNPGIKLEDIREVHSHPMALLQCMDYLEKFPGWKLIETEDTGLSAKHIHQYRHKHTAVIASKLAARLFGLEIKAAKIQTNSNNYTRFLYVVKDKKVIENPAANKASILLHTDHTSGSLAKILTIIARNNINLSKLQSVPIPENPWQYSFHLDMEFDSADRFHKLIEKIKPLVRKVRVFGMYQKGRTVNG